MRRIRLTENKLRSMIREAVRNVIAEGHYADVPDGYDNDWRVNADLALYDGNTLHGYGKAAERLRHLNGNAPYRKQEMDRDWYLQGAEDLQKLRYNHPLSMRNSNVEPFDDHNGMYERPAIRDFDAANRARGINTPKHRGSRHSEFDSPGRLMFNDYGEYIGQND